MKINNNVLYKLKHTVSLTGFTILMNVLFDLGVKRKCIPIKNRR